MLLGCQALGFGGPGGNGPARAEAQISPGPLARAHEKLEGSLQCVTCHGAGGKTAMTAQCLSCHKEIAWLAQRQLGLHAKEGKQACASCHPDHAGRDFALVSWGEGGSKRFDHRRSGWPLEGKHGKVECADCHKAELRVSPAASLLKRDGPALGWVGLTRECVSCHEDVHRGALDRDCLKCHDTEHWKPTPRFDHAKTDYPLTGKHADVSCDKCHLDPRLDLKKNDRGQPIPVYRPLAHQECSTCHQDPHRGGLGAACGKCHQTSGFRAINRQAFDHDRTRYPLRGRHAAVACDKCHGFSSGKSRNPPFATCTACHTDAHGGTATLAGKTVDCASCHTVDGFKPSTFTVVQHRQAKYPLEGRHQQVKCASCHIKSPPGIPAARLGTSGVWMRPAATQCRDCHADDHGTQLASRADRGNCAACHNVDGWKPSTFGLSAHASLRLPLEGRHAEIACSACHGPARKGLPPLPGSQVLGKAAVALKLKEIECVSCHVDPHEGRFAAAGLHPQPKGCPACHDTRTYRPSVIDAMAHQRYAFPLEGAHRAVPCLACHEEMKRTAPARSSLLLAVTRGATLTFAVTKQSCQSCHQSPHGDQFAARKDGGACESCHGVDGFRPASRFNHDRDATFSLKGAHASVPCAKCHASRPDASGKPRAIYRPVSGKCESCHGDARGPS